MGPTAIIARSHWHSDFSPGFQVGFGRVVVSEIEVPNMLENLV
jgi:hypothetical protein